MATDQAVSLRDYFNEKIDGVREGLDEKIDAVRDGLVQELSDLREQNERDHDEVRSTLRLVQSDLKGVKDTLRKSLDQTSLEKAREEGKQELKRFVGRTILGSVTLTGALLTAIFLILDHVR